MVESTRTTSMTLKNSKTTSIQSVINDKLSKVPIKTSICNRIRRSWLIIVLSLIAIVGIIGIISITLVSFVFLTTTTLSTSTTTTTTTTTATMCFTIPTPRPSNIWLSIGTMTSNRVYHRSTLISQDNSILLTGGLNGPSALSSVEKYIPSTGCFQSMRSMPRARYYHTADQLTSLSGYVLIAGGCVGGVGNNFADLYHPITGDIVTFSLTTMRCEHKSVILTSSQLALIGGISTSSAVVLDTADMINTATNSSFVSATNTMTSARIGHTTTVLGNNSGVALIAGGVNVGVYTASALLYHGSSNAFVTLGSSISLPSVRGYHTATYLSSPINKVLIVGGVNSAVLGTLVLFDVSSLTFSTLTTTLIQPRYHHTATLLPNGKILITGGFNGGSLRTCEMIDPSNNYTVTSAGNLNTNRYHHTVTLIPDSNSGTVLVCGGYDASSAVTNTCELYIV